MKTISYSTESSTDLGSDIGINDILPMEFVYGGIIFVQERDKVNVKKWS